MTKTKQRKTRLSEVLYIPFSWLCTWNSTNVKIALNAKLFMMFDAKSVPHSHCSYRFDKHNLRATRLKATEHINMDSAHNS